MQTATIASRFTSLVLDDVFLVLEMRDRSFAQLDKP